MKIGILTYANVANFGANLQALSTVSYFKNLGHEALIIDWSPYDFRETFQSASDIQGKEHYKFFDEFVFLFFIINDFFYYGFITFEY